MNATFSVHRKSGEHIQVSVQPMRRVCTLKSRVIDALMFGALILSAAGLLCLLFLG